MNTCKDCKFWENSWRNNSGRSESRPVCGSCGAPKIKQGYEHDFTHGNMKPDEVAVETDEGWGMETGPDFGCIHWEKKT